MPLHNKQLTRYCVSSLTTSCWEKPPTLLSHWSKGEAVWCHHQQQPSVSAFISYSTYTFKENFTDIINTQQNTITLHQRIHYYFIYLFIQSFHYLFQNFPKFSGRQQTISEET